MKFIDGIILGAAAYIGWHLMDAIDHGFKYPIENRISKGIRKIMTKEQPKKQKNTIGFRFDQTEVDA